MFPTSGVPEVGQSLGLLLLPVLLQPLPPLPQLVLQQLLLVVPDKYFWGSIQIFFRSHFSKLLTMTGRGRDMVRAPLMAVKVPTNLPSPEMGKMSPYLSSDKFECYFHSFLHCSYFYPTVVMVMMTQ